MKIINARTGDLQEIPFSLGEAGRARWLEEVKISNRPQQGPSGPEDVGYFVFGQERKHVILTKSNPAQRGVIIRVNTKASYTRGANEGTVRLVAGQAKQLAVGNFAYGEAGGVGQQTDELWHVEAPSVFVIFLSGGEFRYLIVTSKFEVSPLLTRDELCQILATDEDPDITEVVRLYVDSLHADIRSALQVAEQLEEVMGESIATVRHYSREYRTIEEIVTEFGLAIPAAMNSRVSGVSGVSAGTLIPGQKPLLALSIGPGGGKRYGYERVSEAGLTRLAESSGRPYTREQVLALVESPDWHSAWREYKDGALTACVIANAGGIHRLLYPDGRSDSQAWEGHPKVSPAEAELKSFFAG